MGIYESVSNHDVNDNNIWNYDFENDNFNNDINTYDVEHFMKSNNGLFDDGNNDFDVDSAFDEINNVNNFNHYFLVPALNASNEVDFDNEDIMANNLKDDERLQKNKYNNQFITNKNKRKIKFVVYKVKENKKKKKTSEEIIPNAPNNNFKDGKFIIDLSPSKTNSIKDNNLDIKESENIIPEKYFEIVRYIIDLSPAKKMVNKSKSNIKNNDSVSSDYNHDKKEFIINLAPINFFNKKALIKSFLSRKRKCNDNDKL